MERGWLMKQLNATERQVRSWPKWLRLEMPRKPKTKQEKKP
jgi:hypothetical protein